MGPLLRIWSAVATIAAAGLGLGAKPADPTVLTAAPFTIIFTPAYPTFLCSALPPPGTVVSKITTIGGHNTAVTLALSGDTTDFALSATTVPANLVVAPGGISSSQCPGGAVDTVTITATQP
jgi:hypothetical protein